MVRVITHIFQHLHKTFQQLRTGDKVYQSKLHYIRPQLIQLKDYKYSTSMDYGGHIFEWGEFSADLLDDNYNKVESDNEYGILVKGLLSGGVIPSFNRNSTFCHSTRFTNFKSKNK